MNVMVRTRILHTLTLFSAAVLSTVLTGCRSLSREDPGPIPIAPEGNFTVRGTVVEDGNPVIAARVRLQATEHMTFTDAQGHFTLNNLPLSDTLTITAWSYGYFVGWAGVKEGKPDSVTIELKPYYTTDNPDYDWFSIEATEGSATCGQCMPSYEEWIEDAHSQSAVNPRFLTMYNGTDVYGNQSPLTRYGYSRDYGSFPLPPDPTRPYYGPGYKLDFPGTAGNCATCHVPGAAAKPGMAYAADPNDAEDIDLEGVFCEFCHKLGEVVLNPATGLPYDNRPGIISMRLYRPEGEEQLFFGNFDDVTRRVSYLPLIEESAFCAPCHFGTFWDVVIYNSYGEWLDSPYSDPENGQTCQDCHMPGVDYDYFVYPEKGGLIRDRKNIFSHLMPGAMDETLMRNAVSMDVYIGWTDSTITISVRIVNDQTGHDVPTDCPLRHLILLVRVAGLDGMLLEQTSGGVLPDWCGTGDPADGYYAGLPGKTYAKVLEELWTGIQPSGAYWNPVRIVSDNRLGAYETDESTYTFDSAGLVQVTVDVELIYRRAFKELMDQKSWDTPDIVMESGSLLLIK